MFLLLKLPLYVFYCDTTLPTLIPWKRAFWLLKVQYKKSEHKIAGRTVVLDENVEFSLVDREHFVRTVSRADLNITILCHHIHSAGEVLVQLSNQYRAPTSNWNSLKWLVIFMKIWLVFVYHSGNIVSLSSFFVQHEFCRSRDKAKGSVSEYLFLPVPVELNFNVSW